MIKKNPSHAEITFWLARNAAPMMAGGLEYLIGFAAGLDFGMQLALRHPEYAAGVTAVNADVADQLPRGVLDKLPQQFPIED